MSTREGSATERAPHSPPPRRPLITANQVTLVRLALIPVPCWLLYQGVPGQWAALVIATLLGCTDFVDGYLARKQGPTVLGSLMDPIADKVFIAATFLPAADLGWVPPWLTALLFVREFFITAARSVYERRDLSLKSSYLARYKTWVQMCGVGVLMMQSAASSTTMEWFFAVCAVLPVVGWLAIRVLRGRHWKGASWFAVSFAAMFVVQRLLGSHKTGVALMYFIVAITWASGLGYLTSVRQLRGRERLGAGDLVRLVGSIVMPALAVAAEARPGSPAWAIIPLVAFELAHGGLDNLLSHHRAGAGAVEWSLRMGLESVLLAVAVFAPSHGAVVAAATAAMLVGATGLVVAFVQKRRYYLEPPPATPATKKVPIRV